MPAPIDATSAPLSDYEKAIEVERKKYEKMLEAKQKMLARYDWAQAACAEAQTALEQQQPSGEHNQSAGVQGQQGQAETPGKGQNQLETPESSNNSTPSKPAHKRVRSSLNAEAPEFVPRFMNADADDKFSSG
ncbi:hypothetical protein UCDDS831_g02877 [Diplodia seriata]|uniref:Uncharacterized protein n=1 Tax=Diplodia seriata TaxID=420778 RepID=A0A0G2ENG4_9PEZI|nr:hypothetical protein UCDDS831_g02877 [Diplodia seriata]